jgi:hypothetical protein
MQIGERIFLRRQLDRGAGEILEGPFRRGRHIYWLACWPDVIEPEFVHHNSIWTERNTRRRLRAAAKRLGKLLENYGQVLGTILGRGRNGVVFKASEGLVKKVTMDRKEARLACWLVERPSEFVPRIRSVWAVRSRRFVPFCATLFASRWKASAPRCSDVFVIVREDLPDFGVEDPLWFDRLLMQSSGYLDSKHLSLADQSRLTQARELKSNVKAFLSTGDFRADNLGLRGEALVFRDIGTSSLLDQKLRVDAFDAWDPPEESHSTLIGASNR